MYIKHHRVGNVAMNVRSCTRRCCCEYNAVLFKAVSVSALAVNAVPGGENCFKCCFCRCRAVYASCVVDVC